MTLDNILDDIRVKNTNKYEYTLNEITEIANEILKELDYYSGRGATPIVKIAKDFGFATYKEVFGTGKSGDIHINGDTKDLYGNDKVILVNKNQALFQSRFTIAYELAHYLFNLITKKNHCEIEKQANTFAAELMMPKDLFIKQYNIAKDKSDNHIFIVMYLSRFFEIPINLIEKRIKAEI